MDCIKRNIYFSNTSKHDSFASLLNEIRVEITISLQTSAEFALHTVAGCRATTQTSRVASQATMKRAFGDSNISASSGKKLYLNAAISGCKTAQQ